MRASTIKQKMTPVASTDTDVVGRGDNKDSMMSLQFACKNETGGLNIIITRTCIAGYSEYVGVPTVPGRFLLVGEKKFVVPSYPPGQRRTSTFCTWQVPS